MKTVRLDVRWALIIGLIYGALQFSPAASANGLAVLKSHLGSNDAAHVSDPEGRVLFSHNSRKQLVPASTLKILTSLIAMHYLGPDYRFHTECYVDLENNLKIKGYGDPLLISETVNTMAARLARKIRSYKDLWLDDTYFSYPIQIPGITALPSEPYDAPNGALGVNFNSVHFTRQKGRYVSAEPQTPLLPFVLDRIKALGMPRGRIILSDSHHDTTLYAGHLLNHFLKAQGVSPAGAILLGKADKARDQLLLDFRSPFPLTQVIAKLHQFSNNFIANQILIASGAKYFGPPGTLSKGLNAANRYIREKLQLDGVIMVEGSGISRKNRLTVLEMDRILETFAPYHHLLRQDGRDFYKTGTLKGIRTRAGFVKGRAGGLFRYVVFLNSPGRSTVPIMQKILASI
jgi:D-alanyl-D-alanine carboxypeptidase/D-alanyl-D-alanine-endopeptidase (penicillin-binding protein 4)